MEKKNKPPQKKHWQKTKKHSGFKEKHFFLCVFTHEKEQKGMGSPLKGAVWTVSTFKVILCPRREMISLLKLSFLSSILSCHCYFFLFFLGKQTPLSCCTVFVTVPEDQWPMRRAAVSYRADRAHCLCYCKVQPQEAILLETKGKPSARLWSCLMWQDAKSHSSPSICGGSGLPLMPSQITETCVNKEVLE